jgi:D-alanyl-D-alanine carboxypeptidase/D-alanyl-D-alanine-endopeptidase (penicillin-binding protein 4)
MQQRASAAAGGRVWWWVVVLAAAGQPAAQAVPTARFVAEAEALGVRTGVQVVDPERGVLFSHRADQPFLPASTHKVLTAIGALRGLAADPAFRTVFRLAGDVLEVVAGGDPNLCSDGGDDPLVVFAAAARALRAADVDAVRDVRLLPGPFVGPARPEGWPQDQLAFAFCAPTGGLVLERGCFRVTIRASDGALAILEPAASTPFAIAGGIRMTDDRVRGSRYGLLENGAGLLASGHFLRRSPPVTVEGAVRDPEALFRRVLVGALERGGVRVGGAVSAASDAAAGAREICVHRSPLAMALRPMLAQSSNFHAEQVFRVLGARAHGLGTFPSAALALREQLAALVGPLAEDVAIADGSGLSRANRTTPRVLAGALAAALRDPALASVAALLPRPGEGTLLRRFRGSPVEGRVRAKTGWIRGASGLTGVVDGKAFAILMNYDPQRTGLNNKLKVLQERIVESIAAQSE